MNITELDTPVATVDLDRLETNIKRLQTYLDEHHIANRPHIKTHKIPAIAHMQLAQGAVGITCQKLGEAEVMVDAGIKNIFVPYNIIGAKKLERLAALAKVAEMRVTVDSEFTARGLSEMATRAGITLTVLVEFDTGMHRCGVQSPQEAADLARIIAHLPGLTFGGLMTYPANENTDPFVKQVKEVLASKKLTVDCVSVGGSPTLWQAHMNREITEYRAGMYTYGDRSLLKAGSMQLDDC